MKIMEKKRSKVVWDLDGTLRDLHGYIENQYGFKIDRWLWSHEGKTIFDLIEENPFILSESPPTDYLFVAKGILDYGDDIEIWTRQPDSWIPSTIEWIQKYIPEASVRFFKMGQDKLPEVVKQNAYIIEDYPNFTDYSRVILIDKPYNKDVKSLYRVTNNSELTKAYVECRRSQDVTR